ncbi:MAG: hypothetical protein ABIG95_05690, partial [Candidatus Woesearchaeota archaeon]
EVPADKLKDYIDPSYECVHRLKLDAPTKKKYAAYKDKLVKHLEAEAELTDKILANFKQTINISKLKGFDQLEKRIKNLNPKEADEERIKFAANLIKVDEKQLIQAINVKKQWATVGEIEEIDRLKQ